VIIWRKEWVILSVSSPVLFWVVQNVIGPVLHNFTVITNHSYATRIQLIQCFPNCVSRCSAQNFQRLRIHLFQYRNFIAQDYRINQFTSFLQIGSWYSCGTRWIALPLINFSYGTTQDNVVQKRNKANR